MDRALEELVWERAHARCEYCQMPQEYDAFTHHLMELTPTVSPALQEAWEATADGNLAAMLAPPRPGLKNIPEQFLVLVTCRDEKQQVELLERFRREGLRCKAL